MTTTVYVKARAHGAIVVLKTIAEGDVGHKVEDQSFELNAWDEREIHIEPGQRLEVTQGTPELVERLTADAAPPASSTDTVEPPTVPTEAPTIDEAVPAPEAERVADDMKKGKR